MIFLQIYSRFSNAPHDMVCYAPYVLCMRHFGKNIFSGPWIWTNKNSWTRSTLFTCHRTNHRFMYQSYLHSSILISSPKNISFLVLHMALVRDNKNEATKWRLKPTLKFWIKVALHQKYWDGTKELVRKVRVPSNQRPTNMYCIHSDQSASSYVQVNISNMFSLGMKIT